MSRRRGSSWAALGVIVLLVGLLTAGPSGGATLAGGISTADGTSVAVIPMGHFNDPANKFFETFTAGPAGSWVLTTPTGVATNGGIVVASPGANAAAVLPWYLLRYTAVRPLDSGHAAGAGEVLPPLAVSPTSLSVASDGSVAFVTRRGAVMVGRCDELPQVVAAPSWASRRSWLWPGVATSLEPPALEWGATGSSGETRAAGTRGLSRCGDQSASYASMPDRVERLPGSSRSEGCILSWRLDE